MASESTQTAYVTVLSLLMVILTVLIIFRTYQQYKERDVDSGNNTNSGGSDNNDIIITNSRTKRIDILVQTILWSSWLVYLGFLVIWSYGEGVTEAICDIFYTLAFISIFTLFWSTFLFWLYRLYYSFNNTNLYVSEKLKNIFLVIIISTYVILIIGVFAFVLPGIESDYATNDDGDIVYDEYQCYSRANTGAYVCVGILVLSIIGWNITFCGMYITKHRQSIKYGILKHDSLEANVDLKTTIDDSVAGGNNESDDEPSKVSDPELKYEIEKQALITTIMVCSSFVSWVLIIAAPNLILELLGFADWVVNAVCVVLILPSSKGFYQLLCGKCHNCCCPRKNT